MKIASFAPEAIKRPVYVTNDIYEIWYSKPVSLGKIHNVKGYWYTADNMRFVSSRDAMEYLIRMSEARSPQEKAAVYQQAAAIPQKAGPSHPATSVTTTRKPTKPTTNHVNQGGSNVNQNHPKFQEWLDFQAWSAQRKARAGASLSTGSGETKVVEK